MSARQLRRRVEYIEDLIGASSDGTMTLEELCWSIWCADKKRYLLLANSGQTSLRFFIPEFERKEQWTREKEQR